MTWLSNSKVVGYKINIEKSICFPIYQQWTSGIWKTITFTWTSPKMNYSGIDLIKYVQDLYEEYYKTLMKSKN